MIADGHFNLPRGVCNICMGQQAHLSSLRVVWNSSYRKTTNLSCLPARSPTDIPNLITRFQLVKTLLKTSNLLLQGTSSHVPNYCLLYYCLTLKYLAKKFFFVNYNNTVHILPKLSLLQKLSLGLSFTAIILVAVTIITVAFSPLSPYFPLLIAAASPIGSPLPGSQHYFHHH